MKLDEKQKKRLRKESVDFRIYDAINTYGIKETASLLQTFLNGDEIDLGMDEGFIVSMFIGWWNMDIENEMRKDKIIIANFIAYSQSKWEKTKSTIWWLNNNKDIKVEKEKIEDVKKTWKKFSDL